MYLRTKNMVKNVQILTKVWWLPALIDFNTLRAGWGHLNKDPGCLGSPLPLLSVSVTWTRFSQVAGSSLVLLPSCGEAQIVQAHWTAISSAVSECKSYNRKTTSPPLHAWPESQDPEGFLLLYCFPQIITYVKFSYVIEFNRFVRTGYPISQC